MATRGVKITGLNTLPNVSANTVLVTVDLNVDETLQTNVQTLGNFILSQAGNIFPSANVANTVRNNAQPNITSVGTLTSLAVSGTSNLGPVGNVKITGGTSGQLLATYGNGTLYWSNDINPGGPNTAVQYNNNGSLGGSNAFTFNNTTNTVFISTLNANTIDVNDLTVGNLHLPVGNGTQQQVLGIVNQNTQELGWKTVPVYYVTVELRDGNTYLSSPNAVLRVYPVQQRDGTFLPLNVTQI
jgi:hypothetical protein